MSAEPLTPDGEVLAGGRQRAFRFRLDKPVAPYLIAIAIGDIVFKAVGPRSGVYAEPSVLDKAAWEFADLEKMIEAAESIGGPYDWGRYDVLVMPPSFPFGGMENPRLTFATPTVIAGDRSLTSLVAHELAHSWSGNLVTNATWSDFWLNEGFTTYFENRIMEALYGTDRAEMLQALGRQDLVALLDELKDKPGDQVLHIDLTGRDPDDGATIVPYEKGAAFLRMVEQQVGRPRFDAWLRGYFQRHAFTSLTTDQFLADFREYLLQDDAGLEARMRVDEWLEKPGLPSNAPAPRSAAFDRVDAAARRFAGGAAPGSLDDVRLDDAAVAAVPVLPAGQPDEGPDGGARRGVPLHGVGQQRNPLHLAAAGHSPALRAGSARPGTVPDLPGPPEVFDPALQGLVGQPLGQRRGETHLPKGASALPFRRDGDAGPDCRGRRRRICLQSVISAGSRADTDAVSKSSGEPAVGVDATLAAEPHLRAVLETQPVILVRLARDGTFMAVNESGVSALGAERLEQLLGTSIAALLPQDERNSLLVFLEKITSGNRGSLEIDLTALTGTRHTMQLHAAPHPGAPDGIDSLLATLRDVTESRRLEQSLVEAMAKQTEQESAHEAERARLAAELAEARSLGKAAEANEVAALERKLAEAAELRSALALQHAAEVEGLTEALDERTRISDEQSARLNEMAASEQRLKAELAEALARHESATAEGASARQALESARESANSAVQEVTTRFEADVQALKDALNQAMEDQAQLAEQAATHEQTAAAHEQAASDARSRVAELERAVAELQQSTGETIRGFESRVEALDRDLAAATAAHQELERQHQARLGQLEAALGAARDAERQVAARFATLAQAANRVAQEARSLAASASASAGITAQALANRIEQPLKDVLGGDISLAMAVATPDSVIAVPADRVEQALVALAVNRGAAMRSGQIVLEIADVTVDQDAAKGRGDMIPGDYALVAVHVAGDGAADGLPGKLFESGDASAWSSAQAELGGAHEATRATGGTLWLAHEGPGVVFELYLPRQAAVEAR